MSSRKEQRWVFEDERYSIVFTLIETEAGAPFVRGDFAIVVSIAMIEKGLNAVFEDFQRSNETRQFVLVHHTEDNNELDSS